MKALLLLEDGYSCEGRSFTGPGEAFGELVFNTALTGYQEVITDPSYAGQIVLMTNPMIGTYGIRRREGESPRVWAAGFVVREYAGAGLSPDAGRAPPPSARHPAYDPSDASTDPRALHNPVVASLADCLAGYGVPGIEGVDTRALTRRIRDRGAMKCGITTETLDPGAFLARVRASPGMVGRNLVREVSPAEPYLYHQADGPRIAVLDCGVKGRTLHELAARGCRVEVFPAYTPAADIRAGRPDGLLLSNGPGDPAALPEIVATAAGLLGKVPLFGICLGHQILGQAIGARTFKLPFGHHGGNHPVRDASTSRVYITTQNHGFAVDPAGLPREAEATFINLNDLTNEGLRHTRLPAFSVQFHPEAAPGPHDTLFLFDEFLRACVSANATSGRDAVRACCRAAAPRAARRRAGAPRADPGGR
jgi:carbamoyl-phosphate synthase small subunit